MRKTIALCVLLCLLGTQMAAFSEEEAGANVSIADIGLSTVFPAGWTIVTRNSVAPYVHLFEADTEGDAVRKMEAEGLYAMAFSPEGDAALRVYATDEDETVRVYYDIDRYTPAMRTEIKAHFLDRAAWAVTGYRYAEAAWTNKEGQGRLLHLQYSMFSGDVTIARGRQVYTVRNGLAFTLDLQVTGRQINKEDERAFNAMVEATEFPVSTDIPLLPVGLTFTTTLPEETYKAKQTVRGTTTKGATVSAWLITDEAEPTPLGETKATGNTFRLDFELPEEGDLRLYFMAELEGLATSQQACWMHFDSSNLPITFTSYPDGLYTDAQVTIAGETIAGVTLTCVEGDIFSKKVVTTNEGEFTFKLDQTIVGERQVELVAQKEGFDSRTFTLRFDRLWLPEDYANYLDGQVQSLSFANLTENAEKYIDRLVKYSGTVLNVSGTETRTYVQLGVRQDKNGKWAERIVAVVDEMEVALAEGDAATLYFEVTGEFFVFSDIDEEGREMEINLPSVRLVTYVKNN